jgi:type I restriction enzyme S subunit
LRAWRTVTVGELCDVVAGGTPARANSCYFGGAIPWVKIGDMLQGTVVSTDETITPAALKNSAAKLLPRGTVLISIFATIGRTAVLGIEAATNQAIAGVVPRDTNTLVPEYLRLYFESVVATLERRARGVAQLNLNSGILKGLPIPVPPLSEQRRIVEVLDRAEALRAKRRATLAELDVLTRAIFLDLFGDLTTNSKEWPVVRLGDLCEEVIDCPHSTPIYSDAPTSYPCVRSSDIQNGSLDLSEAKFVDKSEYDRRTGRGQPRRGDVIYCREGARFGNAARVVDDTSLCLGQRMMLFRPKPLATVSDYLWGFLSTPAAYRQAARSLDGSASPHVNIKEIVAFRLPAPPLSLQNDFARRVAAVEKLRTAHRASLAEMDALFASLQHRAFRGEL